ncbi:hypothetical protein PHYPSEUDO_012995 [Phytophthora pseudosyringae]|uniref:TPX2 C-terminal domain-containing protein n=1 Tax=Phytophthora pseudosyringae TaxID=221518 RepID=A0A8T1W7R5_9STRA|nr:hypothetical protein PHYPSEUDO_012995 [Phytophthora pseudosyringae]
MATLLDTTMEASEPEEHADNNVSLRVPQSAEPETDAPEDEDEDEDFHFNAPSYYDLKNPALERRYVNNADGYFSSPAPSAATSKASPLTGEKSSISSISEPPVAVTRTLSKSYEDAGNNHLLEGDNDEVMEEKTAAGILDTTMAGPEEEEEEDVDVETVLNRSNLLDDREESFEEVFRHYASSSQSSATSSYLLHELDTSTHSSTHGGHFSPHSSQTSSSSAALRASRMSPALVQPTVDTGVQAPRSTTGRFSAGDGGVSSKLMQPTQSYLRRLQAEQRMREQNYMEDVPVEEKPHRVTRPRSPKMHSKTRPANPKDPSRMSSTSRELLKIQEERLHLQLEKLKIREFHEKTKVQRPPTNVHQRSTKQLTIPQTPHFEVDTRVRRLHSGSDGSDSGQDKARPPIAAEKLLTRDFSLPLPPHREPRHGGLTQTPHSPQLHTATRAAHRPPPAPVSREHEKPAAPSYTRSKSGGLTQPMTPQLQTSRRAATHRRPVEVVDHDAEELAKKFHARPLNRNILEPKSYPRYSPAKSDSKARLTAPKLPPSARSVSRPSALERAASVSSEMERHRREREQRLKARQTGQATQQKSVPPAVRRPVIPETPPLKSIQRHREYQENFRRKIEAEQEEREKQHQFRANPMRVTSIPARFEGSTKPLTEVKPFELPGERYLEQARERLEQKRQEEEERLKSSGTFRAKPMPVFETDSVQVVPSTRPLTQTESPMLATKSRAVGRAAFEAAEKERHEREEAFRQQREQQERQLKEEEIKRLRRKDMIFHARPVPEGKPFQLKRDTRPLTEPISPIKHS